MFGVVAGLLGGAVAPLVEQVVSFGATLVKKLALFLAAALCLVVVAVALTIAFDLWIASFAGPIVGALAVAGLYLVFAVAAVALALASGSHASAKPSEDASANARAAAAKNEKIDQFTAPLLAFLASIGLRREQIAVFAGANLAKRLGPVPLVGLAIVAGFLVGRMWQGWDALLSSDLAERVADLITPGRRSPRTETREDAT